MFRFISFSLLVFFTSCGTKPQAKHSKTGLPDNLKIGVSTVEEVKQSVGEPAQTTTNKDHTDTLIYSTLGSLNFSKNILQAYFRRPVKDEIHLQYWLHRWKDKKTTVSKIEDMQEIHSQSIKQMNCTEEKLTIIYDEKTGAVIRVVFYEN